jgi:hypothetical protein
MSSPSEDVQKTIQELSPRICGSIYEYFKTDLFRL